MELWRGDVLLPPNIAVVLFAAALGFWFRPQLDGMPFAFSQISVAEGHFLGLAFILLAVGACLMERPTR